MIDNTKELQHFLLTRFNLFLWQKDKRGCKVRTMEWLDHRFTLFEKYCLPSVKSQTCKDFEWIVLFDSKTPEKYKARIENYQTECPQFSPVYVEPEKGRYFAHIFRTEILKHIGAKRVVTTYLDNDDALNVRFVEDLQCRAKLVCDGTFIRYSDGYQFYTDYKYLVKIHYRKNHFVSVVENGDPAMIKGIFGYGGHYYLDKMKGVKIEDVKEQPMWCEIIHEKNMINDAYFIGAKMVREENLLSSAFGIQEKVNYGLGLYLFRYLPRYLKTFIYRCWCRIFGRHW